MLGTQLKRRSSQLEVMGESWKANTSQCYILPLEQSVPSTAQEGRGAGICRIPALLGTAELQECPALLRAALTLSQGVGERDSSMRILVTSSSSHTAGNYLGWDHQLGKQEKEMGTWWATLTMVCCHPPLSSFLLCPKASLGCLWESGVVQIRTCCGCNFEACTKVL